MKMRQGYRVSDFWAQVVAGNTPASAPQAPSAPRNPAPVQTVGQPWWAAPAYSQGTQAQPQQAAPPQEPVFQGDVNQMLQTVVDPRTTKAQSAKAVDTCPSCGSGNYRGGLGSNEMSRCYDCGYNPRFTQQGAGIPSDKSASATPSRQLSTDNNFNPQQIIGYV